MAQKFIYVEGVGELPFYKRRGTQSVKIRINGHHVRVSLPHWMPYSAAVLYVQQKTSWINQHRSQKSFLYNGTRIGKQHYLHIKRSSAQRYSARISDTEIRVAVPASAAIESKQTQNKLEKYAHKALLIESEDLILPQVRDLATQYNLYVRSIEIKNLKSRWGSCSSKQELAFSLFLVQLPWECIDYVIVHELAHTRHMNHGAEFWGMVESMEPHYKAIRRKLKEFSPHVIVPQT
jgi:predicted metal-dependent hydrolase